MLLSATNKYHLFPQGAWRRSFFVTLFFVSLASCLFWLDTFRGYESEARVLVIGKSPSASTEQVVENFAELTSNLSFYEKVLEMNDLIEDDFEGYPQDERKALWNKTVTVERSEKSGVLVITARQDTREQAKRLADATVTTLFSMAGLYYNIKTDVDLRVIDETIMTPALRQPIHYVLISIGSAAVATTLFFWILSVMPFFFRERGGQKLSRSGSLKGADTGRSQEGFALGASVPYIDPQKFVPARPATLTFESSHEEQQIRKEILASVVPVSETPSNERLLPGMDVESLPFEFEEIAPESTGEEPVIQKEALSETPIAPVKSGEPTIEEYKRRLNELLSGGK
jgi:capsular polysaccharide biosynthesis protein